MKPWHQFQIDHPNRFFEDTYRDYKYIVYQHQFGHLNGYVLLKEDDDREKASNQNVTAASHLKMIFHASFQ